MLSIHEEQTFVKKSEKNRAFFNSENNTVSAVKPERISGQSADSVNVKI